MKIVVFGSLTFSVFRTVILMLLANSDTFELSIHKLTATSQ